MLIKKPTTFVGFIWFAAVIALWSRRSPMDGTASAAAATEVGTTKTFVELILTPLVGPVAW